MASAPPSQEYGQHGDLGGAHADYVDAEYYCVPRKVTTTSLKGAACGSAFVAAIDGDDALVTWGWPAYGVLGRGKGGPFHDPAPHVVPTEAGAPVVAVAAGGKHCACVLRDPGSTYAPAFYGPLVDDAATADVVFRCETFASHAHAVVLNSRSAYFRGLLRAAGGAAVDLPSDVDGVRLTKPLVSSVLRYLYTDRLAAPPHRRAQLAALAVAWRLPALADLCRGRGVESTFHRDLSRAVGDAAASDVVLQVAPDTAIHAHRAVLARYDYFAALLRFEDRAKGRRAAVDYGGGDADVARALLAYVYAGPEAVETRDDPGHTMALLIAADEARITALVKVCERALVDQMGDDEDSAAACLAFCDHYAGSAGLRAAATRVLAAAA